MLDIPMYWLGPLGRMVPLACPSVGVENTLSGQFAQNNTLSARQVLDLQGFRRTWSLEEAWLDANEVSLLEAMFNGTMMPPHRIIDPLRKNRFRPSVAAPRRTTLWNGGTDSWYLPVNNGAITADRNQTHTAITYTSPGDLRQVSWRPDSGLDWNASATNDNLYPNGGPNGSVQFKSRIDPVLPGEHITMSFYAKVSGTGTVTMSLVPITTALVFGTPVTTVISSASWVRPFINYTVPTNGTIVGIIPVFTASAGMVNLQVGPGQLEVGDVASQWEMGYGAPEVAITEMGSVSPRHPMVTASLTIQEL